MPHTQRPIDDAETLGTLEALWAMDHGLQSISRAMHTHLGVTGPQRFVLRVVGASPGLTAGALARTLHDHPSTLTAMLKRLVSLDLVTREGDPLDQRRVRLRLTPTGERLDQLREGTAEAAVRSTLAMVSDEDAATFRRVLGLLADQLERTAQEIPGTSP
ncbi:MAG: MarR family winged helix-turn-helix transcriptional regulator [Pseudomonadota bacterium]|nr:MarR family winged helix-turn-helix transcriptional regulator [Pseudomonadota bacterium]